MERRGGMDVWRSEKKRVQQTPHRAPGGGVTVVEFKEVFVAADVLLEDEEFDVDDVAEAASCLLSAWDSWDCDAVCEGGTRKPSC